MKKTPSLAKLLLAALIAASSILPALALPGVSTRARVTRAGFSNMTAGFSPSADFTAQVLALTEPSLKPSALLQAAQGGDDASWLVRRALAHPQEFAAGESKEALLAAVGPAAAAQLLAAAGRVSDAARSDAWLALGLNALKLQEKSVQPEDAALKLNLLHKAFLSATRSGADETFIVPEGVSRDLQSTLLPYKGGDAVLRKETPKEKTRARSGSSWKQDALFGSFGRRVRNWAAALMLGLGTLVAHEPVIAQTQTQTTQQAAASDAYVAARDINDVLSRWTADVPLYVIGDVGMDDAALKELAQWLSGRHWTIVLVKDASGQRYGSYSDDEAVEYGTRAILDKPGFGALTEPRTGQPDGAVFVVVADQKLLYYRGSEAQDARGLSYQEFASADKGNADKLDRWAIKALRGNGTLGARIDAAVRNTVTEIDARLDKAVADEYSRASADLKKAAAQVDLLEKEAADFKQDHPSRSALAAYDFAAMRAAIKAATALYGQNKPKEASALVAPILSRTSTGLQSLASFEKDYDAAKTAVNDAALHIPDLEAEAKALRDAHPQMSGALANPDVEGFNKRVKAARALLETDPASAASLAQQLAAEVSAARAAILDYPNGQGVLDAYAQKLRDLEGRERASAASEELVKAKQSLAEARELYEKGDAEYVKHLNAAKTWVNGAEQTIASADEAAAAARRNLIILLSLLAFGLAGAGVFLNRRLQGVKKQAKGLIADWSKALEAKLETMLTQLEERTARWIGPASGPNQYKYTGKTQALAEKIREDVGSLTILWGSASAVLDKAKALAKPSLKNFFSPANYKKAIKLLKDEPVAFKPQDAVVSVFGQQQRDWKGELLGDLSAHKPFAKSFEELMKEYHACATRALGGLELIEAQVNGSKPALQKVQEALAAVKARQAAVQGASDGLFLVPSVYETLVPSAASALEKTRETVKTDPVGAMEGSGAESARLAQEAEQLTSVIVSFRAAVLPGLLKAAQTLAAAGIADGWIDKALSTLSGRAESLAAKAASESVAEKISKLEADLSALKAQADRAVELSALLKETLDGKIGGAETLAAASRAELGAALGLPAEKLLVEEGANPTGRLEEAKKQAAGAKKALGTGDNAAAEKALAEAAALSVAVGEIVAATKTAFAEQADTVVARRAETDRVEGLVPAHEAVLERIQKDFAKSVLFLDAGDPAHPNPNGTVVDNVDEAREALASAAQKLDKSIKAFNAGKLLLAADLLRQIAAHQEFARHRLGEIADKQARLDKAVAGNETLLKTLEARVKEYEGSVAGDARVMQPTLDAFEKAKAKLKEARSAVAAVKGDPFQAETALKAVSSALDHVNGHMARNDRDIFAEAERSVKAAESALSSAQRLGAQAKTDSVNDSAAIKNAYKTLAGLAQELASAQKELGVTHNDWHDVDALADRIAGEAAKAAAVLKGEMAAADDAVKAIGSASNKVREAGSWTGSYGVVISGTPGSGSLAKARELLEQGLYEEAEKAAKSAYKTADDAIDEAEAEESRRRRAEEERQEAERRRRRREEEERSRSSSGGFGGGGFGGGHSSGGGHSGGSSWGGGGSGMGKSGW